VILALLALVLLGVVFGGRSLGRALRGAGRVWRPTAGLGALVVWVAALAVGLREDWWIAAGLALLALALTLSARHRRRPAPVAAPGRMSPQEARDILGLDADTSPEAVQAAYRRLIRRVHPDAGGARGLAAQLNLARDVLLGR
jgi:hypothetical protein